MKVWNRNLRSLLMAAPWRAGIRSVYGLSIVAAVLIVAAPLSGYVSRKSLVNGQVVANKWAALPITWTMNPTRPTTVTGTTSVESGFRQAFQTWAAVSTASISFVEGPITMSTKPGFDLTNLITANLTPAEWAIYGVDAMSFTNVTTSATGQILDADILFNPSVSFSTDGAPSLADLQAVATHEIGHLLGLDHTPLVSAVMFPLVAGNNLDRALTADDAIGVSTLYPTAAFEARGSIEGTVRSMANVGVFGAIVVAVGQNGQPVAAAITDPDGNYSIRGLPAGSYTLLTEPMDGPFTESGLLSPLSILYPSKRVETNFTTRFH